MSSKRDLVEAHSFNRRRLVTAFVSGAPGGREVEPVRYGRTLVGGLVLALLIVAGAAVTGFLKPSVPSDWKDKGFVIGKTTGSRFVAVKGTLYPVINTTSARLLLSDDGSLDVDFVPDDKIAGAPQGATIGIPGAPDILPATSRLLSTGWGACTDEAQGIKVTVDSTPAVRDDASAVVAVSSGGSVWVLSGHHRYPLPADAARGSTLRALRLDVDPVRAVPGRWLDLFPEGSPVGPFSVPGVGEPARTGVPGLDKVGTPFRVDGRPFVLDRGGKLRQLSEFAFLMYTSSGRGAALVDSGKPLELSNGDVAKLATDNDRIYPGDWPQKAVHRYSASTTPCVMLHRGADGAPYSTLAVPTDADRAVPADGAEVTAVEEGHGAVVRGSTAQLTGTGSVFLVDSTGTRFAVGARGDNQQSLTSLGYAAVKPPSVPRPWLDLFRDGPALDAHDAALPAADQ